MGVHLPLESIDPVLIGDGLWLVFRDARYWYLKDGALTMVPELENYGLVRLLSDGSVTVSGPGGTYLGMGTGMDKRWVYLKL
jgi:hypothetical protein